MHHTSPPNRWHRLQHAAGRLAGALIVTVYMRSRMRHEPSAPPRPVQPRRPSINRIPARSYEPDTCDHCGYIFDPSVTSDIELITGLCQTCWSNSHKMEESK